VAALPPVPLEACGGGFRSALTGVARLCQQEEKRSRHAIARHPWSPQATDSYKFREMIEFRDRTCRELVLKLIVHTNRPAIEEGTNPFRLGTA
jgi:hypothetical protein